MNVAIVVMIIIALLFGIAFLTKRRFGVLGLALTAGATLSAMWATDLTPVVEKSGFLITAPPMETIVAAVVVLLPAIILLFSGPTYRKLSHRVIGAAAFGLLATAFLLEPLGSAIVLTDDSGEVYAWLVDNRAYIITAGILFALFDLLSVKSSKKSDA
ncbi:MAG: hypothetical protein WAS27_01140 [Candidatus Saccharimonadales bacterium]